MYKILFLPFVLVGCASLYHVQVSDLEVTDRARIIDIKLSETGIDMQGAGHTATTVVRHNHDNSRDGAAAIDLLLALINYGPRTGLPVFTDKYADHLLDEIVGKCPSGKITGLTSVRESREYPYISGEIINVRGYCLD